MNLHTAEAALAPAARSVVSSDLDQPRDRLDGLEQQIERLRSRLRIAVIYAGDKSAEGAVIHPTHNPRPWKSYRTVAQDIADSLGRLGFRHVSVMPDDMRLGENLRRDNIDIAWLNTAGVQGYDPVAHAPAMLEMLGVPYIGHDPLTASTLDNKHIFKRDLVSMGMPTAPFITWHMARGPFRPKVNSRFIRAFKDHWGPYIVKPVSGRASLHVHVVQNEADLPDAVAEVYRLTENHVLIEGYLPGREFCIAVCGPVTARDGRLTRRADPFIFSPIERKFTAEERIFTSMDARPITADRIQPLDPQRDIEETAQLLELGRQVYLDFNLDSLIRLDLRADLSGKMFILEANPKPDLKYPVNGTTNLISAGLATCGLNYDDLILSLFADRLDYLLNHRRHAVGHIARLLE